jgi:hypothetical protein
MTFPPSPSEILFQAYGLPRNLVLEVISFSCGRPHYDVGTVSAPLETVLCYTRRNLNGTQDT